MNLVGPFKGQGYLRLLPQNRPASLEDVRRFALHTTESLKVQLEDPSAVRLPVHRHRQGFRQKREVVSLLRRAGFGIFRQRAESAAAPPSGTARQRTALQAASARDDRISSMIIL